MKKKAQTSKRKSQTSEKKWKKSNISKNKSQNVNLSNKMQKARVRKLQTS